MSPKTRNMVSHQKLIITVSPSTCAKRWDASEYSWCIHYASHLQHHRPAPQHQQAQIYPYDCVACSTPGTVSSLLGIICSAAVGIKPVFVSRFSTQNSGGNNQPMTSPGSSVKTSCLAGDSKWHFIWSSGPHYERWHMLVRYCRRTVHFSIFKLYRTNVSGKVYAWPSKPGPRVTIWSNEGWEGLWGYLRYSFDPLLSGIR